MVEAGDELTLAWTVLVKVYFRTHPISLCYTQGFSSVYRARMRGESWARLGEKEGGIEHARACWLSLYTIKFDEPATPPCLSYLQRVWRGRN